MCYYSSHKNLIKLGELELDPTTRIRSAPTHSRPWLFCIETQKRSLYLDGNGFDNMNDWMCALQECVARRTNLVVPTPFRNSITSSALAVQKGRISQSFLSTGESASAPNSNFENYYTQHRENQRPVTPRRLVKRHSDPGVYHFAETKPPASTSSTFPLFSADPSLISRAINGHQFSLLAMKPRNGLHLSLSFGISGHQPSTGIFVVVFEVEKDTVLTRPRSKSSALGSMIEIGRTEIQSSGPYRWCGSYSIRDFNVLVNVPVVGDALLQFEVYAARKNDAKEDLMPHRSIGLGRISTREILFSPNGTVLLSLYDHAVGLNTRQTSSKLVMIIEKAQVHDVIQLQHGTTFASQSYLVSANAVPDRHGNPLRRRTFANKNEMLASKEQFMRDRSYVLATEHLCTTHSSMSLAAAYLDMSCHRNQRRIEAHTLRLKDVEVKTERRRSSSSSIATDDGTEIESKRLIHHYESMNQYYRQCQNYYESLFSLITMNKEPGVSSCLKRSTQKKDKLLAFLPTNLCCHIHQARYMTTENKACSNSQDYLTITVGCPADHSSGFKDGGLRRLLAMHKRFDATEEHLWERLEARQDIVRCQILSVLTASVLSTIALAGQSEKCKRQLKIASNVGYLLSLESLLSTMGNELGMLEDMDAAVKWVNTVGVQFIRMINEDQLSRVVAVTTRDDDEGVVVSIALCEDQYNLLPQRLREGYVMLVHAVLFTQGINEKQSVANSMLDTRVQSDINSESMGILKRYFELFEMYVSHQALLNPTELSRFKHLLLSLESSVEELHSKKQRKKVNILIQSSELCRQLGAGRVTCCKSGKDRTAMSVTLEGSRLLVRDFQVKEGIHLCDSMRMRGVRRTNVWVNIGKDKYAFNALQLKCLPDCYRPPLSTANPNVVS